MMGPAWLTHVEETQVKHLLISHRPRGRQVGPKRTARVAGCSGAFCEAGEHVGVPVARHSPTQPPNATTFLDSLDVQDLFH
jgi:hypothetical protein